MDGYPMLGLMLIGGLLMLLFWGVVIGLVVWAVRSVSRAGRNGAADRPLSSPESSAVEILKQRYARGEISREEYLNIRRELES